jgi:MYXO-CTERM domain-containing protein
VFAVALPVVWAAFAPAARAAPGWSRYDLGSGSYATRYEPASLDPCAAAPLVLFLHGAGGTPEMYHSYLEAGAEATGRVLLLPAASGAGWSDADVPTVNGALERVETEYTVDSNRVCMAGHSAGAAFAYLLAYGDTGIAGVFTLAAPAYPVSSVADPAYRAPIRMYYGSEDPNYTGGSCDSLIAQWNRLGVPHEEDIQAGYGHSDWPPSSMLAGFEFLARQVHPGSPVPGLCGADADADADADVGSDADADDDAARDAGDADDARLPDGTADAGPDAWRDGGWPVDDESGCGCRTTARPAPWATFVVLLGLVFGRRRWKDTQARFAAARRAEPDPPTSPSRLHPLRLP